MTATTFQTPRDKFLQWEAQMPGRVWLRYRQQGEWRDISWAEAGAQARAVAAALLASGLKPGDRVGIYAANAPHWFIADLACMLAGMVVVPVYITMSPDKVSYVAKHADIAAMFVDGNIDVASLRSELPAGASVLGLPGAVDVDVDWSGLCAHEPLAEPLAVSPGDLWTIVYTSGTTGMPKGVMHAHNTLPHSAAAIPRLADTDAESRLFSYLPLAHVAERVLVELHSFYSGALVAFNTDKDAFAAELRDIRPTFFLAVPRIWTNLKAALIGQMGEEGWQHLTSGQAEPESTAAVRQALGFDACRFAFSGAAPISPKDIEAWRNLGVPLYEGFGQSEIMSGTSNIPDDDRIGSVGKSLDGVEGEVRISPIGEIELRAPGTMLGYYKDPEKTAETIVDGWVRTGDKGRIDEDGFLHITGRVKEIFKTAKGKYVAPAPIENRFAASDLVEQLCLVGSGLPQTVLLVVLSPAANGMGREALAAELEQQRQSVNAEVEAHERISHVIVCSEPWTMENRLLTHTLKLLRNDVEQRYADLISGTEGARGVTVIWEFAAA